MLRYIRYQRHPCDFVLVSIPIPPPVEELKNEFKVV